MHHRGRHSFESKSLVLVFCLFAVVLGCKNPESPEAPPDNRPKVIFDANGGGGTMGTQSIAAGETAALSKNAFTAPSGQVFVGWTTSVAGAAGKSYADQASFTMGSSNATLYAVWLPATMNYSSSQNDIRITGYTYTAPPTGAFAVPWGVTVIENSAFKDCAGLTSLTIPPSVIYIGQHAFDGCSALASVPLPSGITSIEDYAFSGCTSLTSVVIPSSVFSIKAYAFSGCAQLTSATLPSTLAQLGEGAFYGCSSLTGVTIPSNITSIEKNTFYGCGNLTTMVIPMNIGCIYDEAFFGCTRLEAVYISSSVTLIGTSAFEGCGSLKTVYEKATVPPSLGLNAFHGVSTTGFSILVPADSLASYQGAVGWIDYLASLM